MIRTFFFLIVLGFYSYAHAQEALPELPEPIQNLVNEGAQIRFLGKDYGVDAWLTVKNGQEQYFYVLPGGEAFLMGVLFDKQGKLVTLRQLAEYRGQGDALMDALAEEGTASEQYAFKTPAEQMFSDVKDANWVPVGAAGAPVAYAFVDPQCGHCHAFISDVREEIEGGRLQLRLVPVGFRPETRAQAAFLIAAPNPQERWFKHMEGDDAALPIKSEINDQGVQRNVAIMQSWKFDATPMVVYRDKRGEVKIVRGRPEDPASVVKDVGVN